MTSHRSGSAVVLACALAFSACAPRASENDAVARGDIAAAQGDLEEALAE